MPDINMQVFEEAQRNQLVTEVDIQTQVALDDYQVQLSDIANPTQSQDNVVVDRHGEFLPHWNESLDFDTWVKMSIELAGKKLLMIHGNVGLSSRSSISDVMVFGDDFNDLSWNKSASNPVLGVVDGGTQYGDPCIFYESDTFYLFVDDLANGNISLYTSTNGVSFSKSSDPILKGAGGSWEDNHVRDPTVVKVGSVYHMWYAGNDGSSGTGFKIGHATASSITGTWTKDGSNPVFSRGSEGVNEPSVIYESGAPSGYEYKMLFTAGIGTSDDIGGGDIGYAYSANGINWTDYGDILTGTYQDQEQIKIGSNYFMFVNPYGSDIAKSVSTDHINWSTPTSVGGVKSTSSTLDSGAMYAPGITYINDEYWMYYQASNGSHHIIALAKANKIIDDIWTQSLNDYFEFCSNKLCKRTSTVSSWEYIKHSDNLVLPYVLETNIKFESEDSGGYEYGIYFAEDATYHYGILMDVSANTIALWQNTYPEGTASNILSSTTSYSLSLDVDYKFRFRVTSTGVNIDFYDGTNWNNNILSTSQTFISTPTGYYGYHGASFFSSEFHFSRKHTLTEPTWSADGTPQNIVVVLKLLGRAG